MRRRRGGFRYFACGPCTQQMGTPKCWMGSRQLLGSLSSQDVVRGALNTKVERYDLQLILRDFDSFLAEEVHVYHAKHPGRYRLLALTQRPSEIQTNWDATDSSSNKLVLVPWVKVDELHESVYERAMALLERTPGVPSPLEGLVWGPYRTKRLLADWPSDLSNEEQEATIGFFTRIVAGLPLQLDEDGAALFLLSEYVAGRFFKHFLLWAEVDWDATRQDYYFLKYSFVARRPEARRGQRALSAIRGWFEVGVDLTLLQSGSSHVRLRPPEGLAIERLGIIRADRSRLTPEREQVEFYLNSNDAEQVLLESGEPPQLAIVARVSQSSGMRVLVGVLFAALATLPLAFGAEHFPGLWDGVTFEEFAGSLSAAGVMNLLLAVEPQDVVDSSSIALPLAFGVVASAWDRPPVRAYAVTQLVFALLTVAIWLLGSSARTGLEGRSLAVLALVLGILMSAQNIYHAWKIFGQLQPEQAE